MTTNKYNKARFTLSAYTIAQLPEDTGMEVAFAGRSNVGKSSVINTITGNQRLARTSKTPGRTQQLNYFELDPERRLVDLPGYGYAKVPVQVRQHWGKVLGRYFESRQALVGLILIMDIRHPLKPYDEQMLSWCESAELPVHVLLNKADKLSRGAANNCLQEVRKQLVSAKIGIQLFSALKRSGIERSRQVLDDWFNFVRG